MNAPIIGIDPGLSGALAIYQPDSGTLRIEDVPTHTLFKAKTGGGKKAKAYVDLIALANIVDGWIGAANKSPLVVIEQVGSMPGQGVASCFDFGRTTGILMGVCAAHFLRIEQVPPSVWKRVLKVPAAKDGARARASQLLPRHSHYWPRVKDDGRAEAALIALYGAQTFGAPA